MKLTKGNLYSIICELEGEGCVAVLNEPYFKQILQDHEDTKKWRGAELLFESLNDEKFGDYIKRTKQGQKDRQIVKDLEKWGDELRTILEFSKRTYPDGDARKTTDEIYIKVLNILGRRK